jgi:hypothetical protein
VRIGVGSTIGSLVGVMVAVTVGDCVGVGVGVWKKPLIVVQEERVINVNKNNNPRVIFMGLLYT